jgi:hypothetical protein
MDIVYLFAALGVSSVLWSCAQALSARIDDSAAPSRWLLLLFRISSFLGWLGVFARPFDLYLQNRAYDLMMLRVQAARLLGELRDYPPDHICDRYGFDRPTARMRDDLHEHLSNEEELLRLSALHGLCAPSSSSSPAFCEFVDWRKREYSKLGL